VVPSVAVARITAVPAARAVITPCWSTLAIDGVSEVHAKTVGIVAPVAASRSVAKSWSWKPTGSAGSVVG